MYVKKSNFVIYLALAVVVGFGASFLFGNVNVESGQISGDISKASRYNNVKEDPEVSVVEEKLQNDDNYYNLTKNTLAYLDARVSSLDDLTSRTIEVCSDIPELKLAIKDVVSLNAKAYNTRQSLLQASDALSRIGSGKKASEFTQASNSVFVGYSKIENQLSIGKAFVNQAASYLKENADSENAAEVADLVNDWSSYCMQDAMLNGSEEDVAYWNGKLGELATESPAVAHSFLKSICKSSLGQEFIAALNQEFTQNLNQEFTQNLNQEFTQNLNQEFVQNLNQEFSLNLNQEFAQNLNQEFIKAFNQEFVNNINQEFTQSLNQEFVKVVNQEFVNNLNQEFVNNLNQEFTQNLNMEFVSSLNQEFLPILCQDFMPSLNQEFTQSLNQEFVSNVN